MEKRCFKCMCTKSLDLFYKHSRMADGRLNKCIECTKADVKAHRLENLERIRQYDRMRGAMPHRLAERRNRSKTPTGAKTHYEANRNYLARYPDRKKARVIVGNAVRDGRLFKWPGCANPGCSATEVEAHHADYSAPLAVVWLCDRHHKDAHKLVREIQRQA